MPTKPVLDPDVNYEERFLKKYCQHPSLPNFYFKEAFFHPTLEGHLITIGHHEMPEDCKINYLINENNSYSYPAEWETFEKEQRAVWIKKNQNKMAQREKKKERQKQLKIEEEARKKKKEEDDKKKAEEEEAQRVKDEEEAKKKEEEEEKKAKEEEKEEKKDDKPEEGGSDKGDDSDRPLSSKSKNTEKSMISKKDDDSKIEEDDFEGGEKEGEGEGEGDKEKKEGEGEGDDKKEEAKEEEKKEETIPEEFEKEFKNEAFTKFLWEKEQYWPYQGYSDDFKSPYSETATKPDFDEEYDGKDFDYYQQLGQGWCKQKVYDDYKPECLTSKTQISLWKIQTHGPIKVAERYINFSTKVENDWEIKLSLDSKFLIIAAKVSEDASIQKDEENPYLTNFKVIKILNSTNFETVIDEIEINYFNPHMDNRPENADYYYAKSFPYDLCKFQPINDCKQLIVFQGKEEWDSSVYSYRIYDLETQDEIKEQVRDNEFDIDIYLICVKPDDDSKYQFLTYNNTDYKYGTSWWDPVENKGQKLFSFENASFNYYHFEGNTGDLYFIHSDYNNETYTSSYKIGQISMPNKEKTFDFKEDKFKVMYETTDYLYTAGLVATNESYMFAAQMGAGNYLISMGKIQIWRSLRNATYYDISKISSMGEDKLIAIKAINGDKIDIIIHHKNRTIDQQEMSIRDNMSMQFKFPFITILKGGREFFIYNMTFNSYDYMRLDAPIIDESVTEKDSYMQYGDNRFLYDFGDFFQSAQLALPTYGATYYFYLGRRRIYKDQLPLEPIKKFMHCSGMMMTTDKKNLDCCIILTENELTAYSLVLLNAKKVIERRFDVNEVKYLPGYGMVIWSEQQKQVGIYFAPLDFSNKNKMLTLFNGQDLIKHLHFDTDYDTSTQYLYLMDEFKYVKKLKLSKEEDAENDTYKVTADLESDYYVNKNFTNPEELKSFTIANDFLYQKTKGHVLQKRPNDTMDLENFCQPDNIGMDEYYMDANQPVVSSSWLLMRAKECYTNNFKTVVVPSYGLPGIQTYPNDQMSYVSAEMFIYENEEYFMYVYQDYSYEKIRYLIFKLNSQNIQVLEFDPKGTSCYDVKIFWSPNGKYYMYLSNETKEGADESDLFFQICRVKKIEVKEGEEDKEQFEIEKIRRFDCKKHWEFTSVYDISKSSYDYSSNKAFIDDEGSIYHLKKGSTKEECKLYMEDENVTEKTINKMKVTEEDFPSLEWNFKNGGVSGHTPTDLYFIKMDGKNKKASAPVELNFQLEKNKGIQISKVYPCHGKDRIVLSLNENYTDDYIILIWDIVNNAEIANYSCTESFTYLNGTGSKSGYLLLKETYVNLDFRLINYFFETKFDSYSQVPEKFGNRINKGEDLILYYGKKIMKETFIEIESVDKLLQNPKSLNEGNINMPLIRFQVDGTTSLHLYAMDTTRLQLILQYMEDNKPEYLTAVLMKNHQDLSPLDITIMNESPKNTELLLSKLSYFSTSSFSDLFYDHFNLLLSMNIQAFNDYLDTCYFQTLQMRNTKYLKLKKNTDPWLIHHSSCLVDSVFKNQFCNESADKKAERERKKKEEEEKKRVEFEDKKEQDLQAEEDKKIEAEQDVDKQQVIKDEVDSERKKRSEEKEEIEKKLKEKNKKDEELRRKKEEMERRKNKERRLDIQAIEFHWIFNNTDGSEFLKTLSETDNIELFSIGLIRHIIFFMWRYYRKKIIFQVLIPYVIFFCMYIMQITWFRREAEKLEKEEGKEFFDNKWYICNFSFKIINFFWILYLIYIEIRQVIFHKLAYFASFWNLIDLFTIITSLVVIILDSIPAVSYEAWIPWAAISLLFLWLKLFYFGRVFTSTAALIRMIIEITFDMRYFLVLMLVAVAGFANSFYILARNDTEADPVFTGNSYGEAFLYSYRTGMGDFSVDGFEFRDLILTYSLWFLNTLIILIVFLNMLLAIMGDTFDRVQETVENNMIRELVGMMVENANLVNRKRLFKKSKYIFVIQEEKAEESQISWEGRLKTLKKYMNRSVDTQNKLLKSLETKFVETIKQKVEEKSKVVENGINNKLSQIQDKVETIDEWIEKRRQKDAEQQQD